MKNNRWWNCLMAGVISAALLIPVPVVNAEELGNWAVQETGNDEGLREEDTKSQKTEDVKRAAASEGEYTYELIDGEDEGLEEILRITAYRGNGGEIEIPAEIDGKKVTSIGPRAFRRCGDITSVKIPEGVTSIGIYAFQGCSGLARIEIPVSVTGIGSGAFYGCSSLTSIEIPEGVKSITGSAFSGCSGLVSIQVDSENQTYDSREGCNAIIEKESNTLIAGCANTCIPVSVTSIGRSAFQGCSSLTSIEIPEAVTNIGEHAFSNCSGLASIEIPESVTNIGEYAFSGCSSLANIEIPPSVKSIGEYAFWNCSGLASIEIPAGIMSIGGSVLSGCSGLVSIQVDSGNQIYDSREDCNAIIEKESNTLIAGCKNSHIPSNVTSIGGSAFEGCGGLINIKLPVSVTSIGGFAFSGCSDLTNIEIPASVTYIGNSAFSNCSGLTSIELPKGIMSIDDNTFCGCEGLLSIELPSSVESIGEWAFGVCGSLTSIKLPAGLTSIGESAFEGCSGLTSIEFPSGVTDIGNCAFEDCKSLASIELPESVTSIGYGTFWNCKGLTGIKLPTSITNIGEYAFSGCRGLTSIEIPSSVTDIGDCAFEDCNGLVSIELPTSVTGIGKYSFSGCDALTIRCYTDSPAHNYAVNQGIPYELIDGQEQVHQHTYETTVIPATADKNGTITKKCSVCGDEEKTTIHAAKTVSLSRTEYTYNGKAIKPSVTVKDSKGKTIAASNYTVTYQSGSKNVGKYTVTVRFRNNYSGSVKKTFTIQPKGTKLSSVSAKSRGFLVKWKKQGTQTTGYEIQYSTDSKFKKGNKLKKVEKNKAVSWTVPKLKANKKYYVRIRTYKKVKINGKSQKIYSGWSKSKSVKTKK